MGLEVTGSYFLLSFRFNSLMVLSFGGLVVPKGAVHQS